MLKLARTSHWKVGFQIYLVANVTCRTEKLAERGSITGKVGAKAPKMLQSGFKSSWTWTCERENHKRALPGTGWVSNKWGKLSLSQGVRCCSHLTAQSERRQMVHTRSRCSRGLLSRNCKPHFLTRASKESSLNAKSSLRLWDGDEERADRIRRRPGILSNSIREGRNRNSPHRRTALTLATVGVFLEPMQLLSYIFLISCFISQVGRLKAEMWLRHRQQWRSLADVTWV